MCMTIQVTIKVGTGGDNEKIVKKLRLELNRANIDSSYTRNRNGSATLSTNPIRMRTHAQAETIINSFIPRQRPRIAPGQVKLIVVRPKVKNNTRKNDEEE